GARSITVAFPPVVSRLSRCVLNFFRGLVEKVKCWRQAVYDFEGFPAVGKVDQDWSASVPACMSAEHEVGRRKIVDSILRRRLRVSRSCKRGRLRSSPLYRFSRGFKD